MRNTPKIMAARMKASILLVPRVQPIPLVLRLSSTQTTHHGTSFTEEDWTPHAANVFLPENSPAVLIIAIELLDCEHYVPPCTFIIPQICGQYMFPWPV
jgi:hypothetical protein